MAPVGLAPSTTVILAHYRQPRALELQLAALAAQTCTAFDVIVADDGSDPPASATLERLRADLPFRIASVWQPDEGFGKARAQNLAASRSASELLLFLDGDCLPFRDWVEVYQRAWRPDDFFVSGYFYLDDALSASLAPADVAKGAHECAGTPAARRRAWKRHLSNRLGRRQTRPRIRGGNLGVCAQLFRRVDGFDEVYCGYGREDSDLRNRMRNAGSRGCSLWHRAHVAHLSRTLAPSAPRDLVPEALYAEGRRGVRARRGLSRQLAAAPGAHPAPDPAAECSTDSSASAPRSQSKP